MATYTVKSGDTLSGIASRNGMTLAQIRALNPQISNPNAIRVGQVINISGASGQATGSTISWDDINNLGNNMYGGSGGGVSWVKDSAKKPAKKPATKPAVVPVVSTNANGSVAVKPVTVNPATSAPIVTPTTDGVEKTATQKFNEFAVSLGMTTSTVAFLGVVIIAVLAKSGRYD